MRSLREHLRKRSARLEYLLGVGGGGVFVFQRRLVERLEFGVVQFGDLVGEKFDQVGRVCAAFVQRRALGLQFLQAGEGRRVGAD